MTLPDKAHEAAAGTATAAAHSGHWQHATLALIADALQRIADVMERDADGGDA